MRMQLHLTGCTTYQVGCGQVNATQELFLSAVVQALNGSTPSQNLPAATLSGLRAARPEETQCGRKEMDMKGHSYPIHISEITQGRSASDMMTLIPG